MNDGCDEGGEFLLAVDEVGIMQGCDCGFEDVGAEVGADGGGVFEAGEEGAEDADDGDDGAGVADGDCGGAEEEDGFEDGGVGEDEVAHWGAGGGAAGFGVGAGEFWEGS